MLTKEQITELKEQAQHGKNESRGNDVRGRDRDRGTAFRWYCPTPLASVLMCGSVYTNNIFLNYAHENNIKRMRSIDRRTEKVMIKKSTSCSSMCLFLVSPCPLVPFVTL